MMRTRESTRMMKCGCSMGISYGWGVMERDDISRRAEYAYGCLPETRDDSLKTLGLCKVERDNLDEK